MARIGVMTFLHNENYGSSLQAWALQHVLREMGHECEHIDYQPDVKEKTLNLIRSRNSPALILDGIRKRSVRAEQAGAREKSRAIPEFYAREMRLSPVCRNRGDLRRVSGRYDTLLCGSDQIWNPVWLNPAYFLDFAEKGQRRLAYAPSLGIREMPGAAKARALRRLTEGFEALSVREEEGAELLRRITGREVPVMPDPVCLLNRQEWAELAARGAGPADEGKRGILCYFIGENRTYWELVRTVERHSGLPVRILPVTAESYGQAGTLLEGVGPEGFLRAVMNARILITDSFHGLVFGTIFGVQTETLRRYRDEDPENKNSRIDHFLRKVKAVGTDGMRETGRAWLREHI